LTLYFLWEHAWMWAAAAVLISVALGAIVTPRNHEENLAQTTLGKIMLLHLHPVNVLLHSAGLLFLLYGVWVHSAIYIMMAGSIILIGHMWGWHRVNEAL
jgi:flagellar biosynthesis component FlhA